MNIKRNLKPLFTMITIVFILSLAGLGGQSNDPCRLGAFSIKNYYEPVERCYGEDKLQDLLKKFVWEKVHIENKFDCSQMSIIVERYLENNGFTTTLVYGNNGSDGHLWLHVQVSSDPKAIPAVVETTSSPSPIILPEDPPFPKDRETYASIYDLCRKFPFSEIDYWSMFSNRDLFKILSGANSEETTPYLVDVGAEVRIRVTAAGKLTKVAYGQFDSNGMMSSSPFFALSWKEVSGELPELVLSAGNAYIINAISEDGSWAVENYGERRFDLYINGVKLSSFVPNNLGGSNFLFLVRKDGTIDPNYNPLPKFSVSIKAPGSRYLATPFSSSNGKWREINGEMTSFENIVPGIYFIYAENEHEVYVNETRLMVRSEQKKTNYRFVVGFDGVVYP